MAISIIDLTPTEVASALTAEEGHFSDVKAIEIAPASLTKTMSAFANTDAGELFVGIDENRKTGARTWRGFSSVEAANGHMQAFEATFPLDGFVDYQFLRDPENPQSGLVLKASIQKTPDIRHATSGTAYVRLGAQNLPVKRRRR